MNPTVLNGKKVIGTEGFILGEVEGVDVDAVAWRATTLYVSLSDQAAAGLGIKKYFLSKTTICLPTQVVKSVGDVITLSEPLSNLQQIAARECLINRTRLRGKSVMTATGQIVGEVEALDLRPSSWQVEGLQVSLNKDAATELGFNKSLLSKVAISIPTRIVKAVGNMVILNENIQDLKTLAKCLECS
jgi:sporulation protein YlmC with PRC-barrel domain